MNLSLKIPQEEPSPACLSPFLFRTIPNLFAERLLRCSCSGFRSRDRE